jgi:hypothetical protein
MALEKAPPELGRLHDTSILWRVSAWGTAATVALAAAVMITRTDIGAQRLRLAFSSENAAPARSIAQTDNAQRAAARAIEAQRLETQRLETRVRQLAADRDRLIARIASLEHNLDDMTGSIKRELALVAATAPSPPPALSAPVATPPQAGVPAKTADANSTAPSPSEAAVHRVKTETISKAKYETEQETQIQTAVKPAETEPQSQVTIPAAEPVPMPPVRVAAAPASEPAAAHPRKAELGVDVGGARTMEVLNARWVALKANFGPLLDGLHPLVAHDRRPGAIPYRLVVGPLSNGAAAAHVCARFAASRVTCRTTRFAGEHLAQK